MKLHNVGGDLDRLLALAGAVLSAAVLAAGVIALRTPADYTYYFFLGSIGFISCVVWLRARNDASLKDLNPPDNHSLFLLGNVLFFLFFGCAVLSLHLRPEVYVRPLSYFVFIALIVGAIALEIMACDATARSVVLTLTQIITVGFLSQISVLTIFPNVVGADSWAFEQFTWQILRWGHIPTLGQYNTTYASTYGGLPMFNLEVAATSLLTSLDYKWAATLSVGASLVIICVLFTFLIGKSLINVRVGLLGGLVLVTANEFIYFGLGPVPNTLGAIFLLVSLYVLFTILDRNRDSNLIVLSIFMSTLILTHTISAMAMAFILLSGLIAALLYRKLNDSALQTMFSLTIAASFIVAMVGWWVFASGSIAEVASWVYYSQFSTFSTAYVPYLLGQPLWELSLRAAGICAFLALALIGCFYMISKKFGSPRAFVLVAVGVIPVILSFSRAFGAFDVVERWTFFSQILYAVPLGVTLLVLSKYMHSTKAKSLFVSMAVAFLSLIMVLSPTANQDNHLLGSPPWERYTLTSSELSAINTTAHLSNNDIISDICYMSYARSYYYANLITPSQTKLHSTSNALLLISSPAGTDYRLDAFYHSGIIPVNVTFTPPQGNATSLGARVYDDGLVTGYENSNLANLLDYWLRS
jgi:hypothetical protein